MSKILHTTKFIRKLKIGDWRWPSPPIQRTHCDILLQRNWRTRSLCTVTNDRYNAKNYAKQLDVKENTNYNVHEQLNKIAEKIKFSGHILKSDVEQILNTVIKNGTLTQMQALLLLRTCNYFTFYENLKTRTTLCNNVWSTIKTLDVKLDINCYNALILVYLENNIDFSPNDILTELKEKNIQPNYLTYQRFVDQYCRKGDIVGVTKILEIMNNENIPINETIFNSLIQGHSVFGNDSNALNILNIMKKAGIDPTSSTYANILCIHAKNGKIDDIRSVLQECKERRIHFMNTDILNVIYTLAVNKHSEYIEETRKLVISDLDVETLVKYCGILKQEKIDARAFENAVYFSYQNDKPDFVIPLFEELKELGGDVREHYFFPYMVYNSKKNNLHGTLDILRIMFCKFNIKPSIRTLINFVIPNIMEPPEKIIRILESYNISFTRSANAVLFHLLQQNKLEKACSFISQTTHAYKPKQLIDNLTNALNTTKDIKSFMKIVDYNYNTLKNDSEKFKDDFSREMNGETFVLTQLNDIINKISNVHGHIAIKEMLGYMCKHNLKLNDAVADKMKAYLGQYIDQTTTFFLQKLKSNVQEESENVKTAIGNKDTKTVKHLIQKLEEEQINVPPAFAENIINFFAKIGDFKEVEKWLQIISKDEDLYKMDSDTIMHCVNMYLKNKNLDDASKVLKYPCLKKSQFLGTECMNAFDSLCFRHPDRVMEVFKTNKKDYAMELYKFMSENHNILLQKFILYKFFIDHEDADSLQQVTDLAVKIIGEKKALHELAIAFSECNRIQQAKKIFMIDGIISSHAIEQTVELYLKKKEDHNLENLCMTLNGLYEHVDDLFFKLIKLYEQNKQFDKCRNLWTKLQDDSNTTSFFLLNKLEQRLNKNYSPTNSLDNDVEKANKQQLKTEEMYERLSVITNHVNNNNIDKAIQQINLFLDDTNKLKHNESFLNIVTNVVVKLVEADDLRTSAELANKLMNTTTEIINSLLNDNDKKDEMHGPLNAIWLKLFIEDNPEADDIWNSYLKKSVFHAFGALDLLNYLNLSEKFPDLCEKVMDNTTLQLRFKNRFLTQSCTILLKSENTKKFELVYNCLLHGVKILKYSELNKKILASLDNNLKDGLSVESLRDESERLKQMAI
ncbi:PREDICTED: uncharacterized protein LOC105360449 [Ceratosolen solmsi marchali]|uniref:Uncharacterized protein LOC105360449 n=1 Tax=Ceratosolen solmsi marchali TaxID=326594 RepID=A0AAJ6YCQ5_9HYME|nr:PREDICTED: uncharacterized protein LOC105360449 [Ceratosolen solmsi marchali]